ncbi:MAG TPA: hypothetical protein VN706_23390 [Gemmatimonadaceae bacterium]|nr:hypothetical protein [Gemmatimonadaceae bacterium]
MAYVTAAGGPPPGPGSAIHVCPAARGYLCITVLSKYNNNVPALVGVDVTVTIGVVVAAGLRTDDQGQVTLAYDSAADFADVDVKVQLDDARWRWEGTKTTTGAVAAEAEEDQGGEGTTITPLSVEVGGTFTLTARIKTRKPDGTVLTWPVAWSAQLSVNRWTTLDGADAANAVVTTAFGATVAATPGVELANVVLPCIQKHQFGVTPLFVGYIPGDSFCRLTIDGVDGWKTAVADEASYGGVTIQSRASNQVIVSSVRHGATVVLEFCFAFKSMLIVGEGTSYEYAVALADKFSSALGNPGFRWIIATQYDVTDPAAVSTNMMIRRRTDGARQNGQNQRALLAAALAKNLLRRTTSFDATLTAHWQNVRATYGDVDAVMFNNPHPGYGMHKCLVLGLTAWVEDDQEVQALALNAGRAISVYTFGYPHALARNQLDWLLGPANDPLDFTEALKQGRQRAFVRVNAVGRLNYANARTQAIALQYYPANTVARALTIRDAFTRMNGDGIGVNFGTVGEFHNDTVRAHYAAAVDTIGLQGYLLRCYRYYAPSVTKVGGFVYVNCSENWANLLTASFRFTGALADTPAMNDHGTWPTSETFVHYNTNFTSLRHHPSWYSTFDFDPDEPNITTAHTYYFAKT